MCSKYLKYAGIAAFLTGFSVASAGADEMPAPPPNMPAPPINGPQAGGGMLPGVRAARALTTGWNEKTCSASKSYVTGSYHYIYVYNTDGSYFYWYTNNGEVATQSELQFACQHRTYWIYITNTSTASYNQVYIRYP